MAASEPAKPNQAFRTQVKPGLMKQTKSSIVYRGVAEQTKPAKQTKNKAKHSKLNKSKTSNETNQTKPNQYYTG